MKARRMVWHPPPVAQTNPYKNSTTTRTLACQHLTRELDRPELRFFAPEHHAEIDLGRSRWTRLFLSCLLWEALRHVSRLSPCVGSPSCPGPSLFASPSYLPSMPPLAKGMLIHAGKDTRLSVKGSVVIPCFSHCNLHVPLADLHIVASPFSVQFLYRRLKSNTWELLQPGA